MRNLSEDRYLPHGSNEYESWLVVSASRQRRTRGFIAIVFAIVLGLVAGWIAGKSLSGAITHSALETGVHTESDPASTALPQPEPQPPANSVSSSSQAPSEQQGSAVKPEATPQEPEAGREREEIPNYEQSTKEIGRQALKQMIKELKRMNRGKPKNTNEDLR